MGHIHSIFREKLLWCQILWTAFVLQLNIVFSAVHKNLQPILLTFPYKTIYTLIWIFILSGEVCKWKTIPSSFHEMVPAVRRGFSQCCGKVWSNVEKIVSQKVLLCEQACEEGWSWYWWPIWRFLVEAWESLKTSHLRLKLHILSLKQSKVWLTFWSSDNGELLLRKYLEYLVTSAGKSCSVHKYNKFRTNKLAKFGNAIAISKSETMNDSLTHWLTGVTARRCYRI